MTAKRSRVQDRLAELPGVGVVRHPDRVHGMVLDSPLLSRHDIVIVRRAIHRLLLRGDSPETAALAPKMRKLVAAGVMTPAATQVVVTIYGYGGADLLERQLDLLLDNRKLVWWMLSRFTAMSNPPYRYEEDLVSRIAFRELDYAAEPDGLPLDPAVAERVASLLPNAALVSLPSMAHSALDFREPVALASADAVRRGDLDGLAAQVSALDALPPRAEVRLLWKLIGTAAAAEGALPIPTWLLRRLSSA